MAKLITGLDKNYVEVVVELKADPPKAKAILISDGDKEIWVPRSIIEGIEPVKGTMIEITIPEWFAQDKGLI